MIILDKCERNSPKVEGDFINLTPAEYVVFIIGGGERRGAIEDTAKALGRTRQSICEWYDPKLKRSGRGLIPSSMQHRILEVAQERGLDITAYDLIYGRKVRVKFE